MEHTMTRRQPAPRRGPPRRVNAPLRPRPEGSTIPDVLFAITATCWTIAAVFAVLTLMTDEVGGGQAGVTIARIFAGVLALTGLALCLLGISILGEHRNRADHYAVPMLVGLVVGLLEAALLIGGNPAAMALPPVAFLLALRPVRRAFRAIFGLGGRR
jgi:hypothetical protein